ncbi:MAG: histidine kinase dimerization/phospho-acceptor domain-containing protein, partial [Planctomycetota bacterium]
MTIALRILIGFGLVFGLLAGIVYLNHQTTERAAGYIDQFREESDQLAAVQQLRIDILEFQRNAITFVDTGHSASAKRVEGIANRLLISLATIHGFLSNDEGQEVYDRLSQLRLDCLGAFRRLVEDRGQRDTLLTECRALGDDIIKEIRTGDDSSPVTAALAEFTLADRLVMRYVDQPDSKTVREAVAHLKQSKERLAGTSVTPTKIDAYQAKFLTMVQTIRGYLSLANVVLAGQAAEFNHNAGLIEDHFRESIRTQLDIIAADERKGAELNSSLAALALVIGLLACWVVGRSITRPISKITETFESLAEGGQSVDLPPANAGGEIGKLSQAARVFAEKNNETQRLLEVTRETGEALEAKTDALERANTELEQFAYVASHDLQEPLRMVACYVQLLQEDYGAKLDDEAREYIQFAAEGATRMQVLILELLELSRLGRFPAEVEETDTKVLLDSVCRDFGPTLQESGFAIRTDDLPRIRAYPRQLRQVFQNLVSNAIKYRDPKAGESELLVHATQEGDRWVFSFKDNGIGIDPRKRQLKLCGQEYQGQKPHLHAAFHLLEKPTRRPRHIYHLF